jgi:hypothetical protein
MIKLRRRMSTFLTANLDRIGVVVVCVPLHHMTNAVVPILNSSKGKEGHGAVVGSEETCGACLDRGVDKDRIPNSNSLVLS